MLSASPARIRYTPGCRTSPATWTVSTDGVATAEEGPAVVPDDPAFAFKRRERPIDGLSGKVDLGGDLGPGPVDDGDRGIASGPRTARWRP